MWTDVRAQFPALKNWAYLNTATFGQLPRRAVEAVNAHFTRRDEGACQDFLSWFDDADRIRGAVGQLIHCEAADVAFVPNTSTAISLLLGGLHWHGGDQIVTLEDEFPNQFYFPAHLARSGVELVRTPFSRFYESLTPRTRVVAISSLNYATGFRAPVAEIAAYLRPRGILFYLDGTQGLGALTFNARAVRPDMYAVNAYKWMCSPNGAGFVYMDAELRARLAPAVVGWRSDKNWRSVDELNHGAPEFAEAAEKYEGGMLAFACLYGMEQTIALMLEIGPEKIEQRVLELGGKTRVILEEAGGIVEHPDTPILAAKFPRRSLETLSEQLKAKGVVAAVRQGRLRVSPHFYNDETDLNRLREAL